ncbi:MAG: hypothetical protein Q4C04_04340 [Clostridia bacterium]|nr:hypothetical protein [Clostridia bacterium]
MNNPILAAIDRYQELLIRKDELEAETKDNNAKIKEARDKLAEMMIDEETPKIVRSGYSFSLTEKTKFSKRSGADDELFELLRADGLGDIIKPTVAAATLQAALSDLAEKAGGTLPGDYEPLISIYSYFDVNRRRAK